MQKLAGGLGLLITAALLAACSAGLPTWLGGKGKAPDPAPAAEAAPAPAPALPASSLFPQQDRQYRFSIRDAGAAPYDVREYLLRAGDATPAAQAGVLYAVWVMNSEGIWRADPKGGAALLRYLPARLNDGEVWKQASGNAQVWFRLSEIKNACGQASCWELTVLNRGERLVYRFAPGEGPNSVVSEHWTAPEQSYVKSLMESGDSRLAPSERTKLVESASKMAIPAAAPVVPVTAQEFDQTLQQMMGSASAGQPAGRGR